jgi:hypothetical protein
LLGDVAACVDEDLERTVDTSLELVGRPHRPGTLDASMRPDLGVQLFAAPRLPRIALQTPRSTPEPPGRNRTRNAA